jgi:abortive infection bacteriophage resistance protein
LLQRVSYFRLSAYFLTEKVNEEFSTGTTLDKIERIYIFDCKLRNFLLSIIESIEIAFRTQIAYLIAHKYGNLGHLDSSLFNRHELFLSALNKEMHRSSEPFIAHYLENCGSVAPVWIALEIVSLSALSRFYSNLLHADQDQLAKQYYGVSASYVRSWLKCLNDTRNICAHHGRIYNRVLPTRPKLFRWMKKLSCNRGMIFSQLIPYKNLYLDKYDWNTKMTHLSALLEEYQDCIHLQNLGFPKDWMKYLYHDV